MNDYNSKCDLNVFSNSQYTPTNCQFTKPVNPIDSSIVTNITLDSNGSASNI